MMRMTSIQQPIVTMSRGLGRHMPYGQHEKARQKPQEWPVRASGCPLVPDDPQDSQTGFSRTPGCSRSLQLGLDSNGFIHVRTVGYNAATTRPIGGNSFFTLMALPERFSVVADSELVRGSTLYCDRRSTPRTSDWGHGDLRHLRCVTKCRRRLIPG